MLKSHAVNNKTQYYTIVGSGPVKPFIYYVSYNMLNNFQRPGKKKIIREGEKWTLSIYIKMITFV